MSRIAGLVNLSPRVSGLTFKSCGFSGFEMCHGLQVWLILALGFRVLRLNLAGSRVLRCVTDRRFG